jgi:aryl-alcohol dehydrogenase-like predicted oxidoreductase
LGGKKKVDVSQGAGQDPSVSMEDMVEYLADLVRSDKIVGIGLSGLNDAETIKRAYVLYSLLNLLLPVTT